MSRNDCSRAGTSLAEMLVVLTIAAVLLTLAVHPIALALDRAAVRSATAEMATVFSLARQAAIHERATVVVHIDSATGSMRVTTSGTALLERQLRATYGVQLVPTRDSMAFDAHGLGVGVANLSVVARRRRAMDTLFLSRLGRVRW
ncbi:MAG TPA: GspH/FimT family pseudopilin [Gemmatimonadaceae bacterium]|nr:GspH/FimT family pseudopilin [Gemmatimonadaceae bacterium]